MAFNRKSLVFLPIIVILAFQMQPVLAVSYTIYDPPYSSSLAWYWPYSHSYAYKTTGVLGARGHSGGGEAVAVASVYQLFTLTETTTIAVNVYTLLVQAYLEASAWWPPFFIGWAQIEVQFHINAIVPGGGFAYGPYTMFIRTINYLTVPNYMYYLNKDINHFTPWIVLPAGAYHLGVSLIARTAGPFGFCQGHPNDVYSHARLVVEGFTLYFQ